MSNRYAGKCAGCGNNVPAKAGKLLKRNNRWAVAHYGCAVPTDAVLKVRADVARNTAMFTQHMSK